MPKEYMPHKNCRGFIQTGDYRLVFCGLVYLFYRVRFSEAKNQVTLAELVRETKTQMPQAPTALIKCACKRCATVKLHKHSDLII